jgi:hypothetical protein
MRTLTPWRLRSPFRERYAVGLLLVQLGSGARGLLDRVSRAIHIQASSPLTLTNLSSTTAFLALPTWRAPDRPPNLWTQLMTDLLLRLMKMLRALMTLQEQAQKDIDRRNRPPSTGESPPSRRASWAYPPKREY